MENIEKSSQDNLTIHFLQKEIKYGILMLS